MESKLYIGVDVGSTSVRCAVVDSSGHILRNAVHPIKTWSPCAEIYQQSSDNIWNSVCRSVKEAMLGYDCKNVAGIGFDATCSLVVLDVNENSLTVSRGGEMEQNVILWMDHRAVEEASFINSLQLPCLKFVGGSISPEMEVPKIMWIKKHLPEVWSQIGLLLDLPDYLTFKATGSLSRSLCSVVCKWLYKADEKERTWDVSTWNALNLEELNHKNFEKIGNVVLMPGKPSGSGLSSKSANELGLKIGTSVGTSMIDAHAGGIGILGCQVDGIPLEMTSRLAIISGTSSCHMKISQEAIFVPGVWGPYYSAMVPDMWLNEAGQSSCGLLIDHIIFNHPAYKEVAEKLPLNKHIQSYLNEYLLQMSADKNVPIGELTRYLHIWPDFHGNRSPLADPTLKGMIMGLTLSKNLDDLAKIYLAAVQALAYGTLHIIESLEKSGHKISSILVCGGLSKNQIFIQTHADVTNRPVILPETTESVLLGSAILGAAASGDFKSVKDAMVQMGGKGKAYYPNKDMNKYHNKKFEVFLEMLSLQKKCQRIMDDDQI